MVTMDDRVGIFWDREGPIPPEILAELQFVDPEEVDRHRRYAVRRERRSPHAHNLQHWHQHNHFGDDFVLWEPEQCVLAPLSVSLRAQITQDTAQVTITQLFWNNSDQSTPKGSYSMPLPAGCTVTDFICRIGSDKIVKAKVKPKEEARDAFDRAVRNDRTAALLEQTTPEVFSTTLGNIPKRTKIRVEITFITLLKYEFIDQRGRTTFTIPASLASSQGNPRPHVQAQLPAGISQKVSIDVEISAAEKIQKITSTAHDIVVDRRQGTTDVDNWEDFAAAQAGNDVQVAFVSLRDGSTFLTKDFVLDIVTTPQDGEERPQAWLESHPTLEHHKAIMLTIPPKFFLRDRAVDPTGEIVFVADRSGSMTDKISSLKSAMKYFLMSIPRGRSFNLWSFGSDYSSLWDGSRPNSDQETLERALRHIDEDFAANMGGTELLPVLKAIVDARDERRTTDVIVLTDGHVFRMDQTLEYVQHMKLITEGAVRVFALGIGHRVSHELVEGIAKAGGGYAEVIPSASHGGWESRVVAVLEAAVHGHLAPLRIQPDGMEEEPVSAHRNNLDAPALLQRPRILKSPADLSTLSPFLRQRVYMLFETLSDMPPLDSINIIRTSEDGHDRVTRVLTTQAPTGSSFIHKLGARALLGDLEKGQSWIQLSPNRTNRNLSAEAELVRTEGEMLGCKWSLVSKWTSFYAIDEPYQPDEHRQEPFMDVDHVRIPLVEETLDLLRPRGPPNRPGGDAALGLPEAAYEIQVDSDEEDESSSDSEGLGPRSYDANDSDSGDDDGGGDGGDPRGGDASHAGNAGSSPPPPPGPDDTDNNGNGSNTEEQGPQNGSGTTAAADAFVMAANTPRSPSNDPAGLASDTWWDVFDLDTLAPDMTGTNIDTSSNGPGHKIAYGAKDGPEHSYPRASDRPHSKDHLLDRSGSSSRRVMPSKPKVKGKYSDDTSNPFSLDLKGQGLSRTNDSSARTTTMSGPRGRPVDSDISTDSEEGSKPSIDSRGRFIFARHKRTTASGGLESLSRSSRHSLESRDGFYSAPRVPPTASGGLESLSRGSSHSTYVRKTVSSETPKMVSDHYGGINAPRNNLPAATSLLPQQTSAPLTADQKHGEQIVQKLVRHQQYDGSFKIGSDAVLIDCLGDKFLSAVQTIQQSTPALVTLADNVAVTMAIVVVFEEKFQFCKDLWTMIHQKAQTWLHQRLSDAVVRDSLYAVTRSCIQSFEIPKPESTIASTLSRGWPNTIVGHSPSHPTGDPFTQSQLSIPTHAPVPDWSRYGHSNLFQSTLSPTAQPYPLYNPLLIPTSEYYFPAQPASYFSPIVTRTGPAPAHTYTPQKASTLATTVPPVPFPAPAQGPSPTPVPVQTSRYAPAPIPPHALSWNEIEASTNTVPLKRWADSDASSDTSGRATYGSKKQFACWGAGDGADASSGMPMGMGAATWSFGETAAALTTMATRAGGADGGGRVTLDSVPGEEDLL